MSEEQAFEPPARAALRWVWARCEGPPGKRGYWLVRSLLLRSLGALYFVAFATGAFQLVPLVGRDGLLPADLYLSDVARNAGSVLSGFIELPTVFWWSTSDEALVGCCVLGMVLAAAVVAGLTNSIAMLVLWALYMSVDHVGQRWYAFGWENQLLETGFLAVFLASPFRWRPFDPRAPPSVVVIWLMRWLVFRIMLGAGLIKLRGDSCWADLTCLEFHFETQPVPNPISWWLHHLPSWVLQVGVALNHFVELVVPWFVFGPRRLRLTAGVLLIGFQGFLIISGNLSFLNWLTIIPCIACFDDAVVQRLGVRRWLAGLTPGAPISSLAKAANAGLVALVLLLSFPVVANLLADRQVMNRSFDDLHLVNTYGAFGSVGRERLELVIEGTTNPPPDEGEDWVEYEFKCKPGDPSRRPCLISPYHYRLDWLIWFAALDVQYDGELQREGWVIHLLYKLLEADQAVLGLLEDDPFAGQRPRFVRVLVYRYRFSRTDEPADAWWIREPLGVLIRPIAADDPELLGYLAGRGWLRNGP